MWRQIFLTVADFPSDSEKWGTSHGILLCLKILYTGSLLNITSVDECL